MGRSKPILVAIGAALLGLAGCDTPDSKTTRQVTATVDYSRFQPTGQITGLALDTKTGMLCHTFNVHRDPFIGGQDAPNGAVRNVPGYVAPHQSLDSLPFCVDLSQNEKETVGKVMAADRMLAEDSDVEINSGPFAVIDTDGFIYNFETAEKAKKFSTLLGTPGVTFWSVRKFQSAVPNGDMTKAKANAIAAGMTVVP
jgi:hypothetical protein